MVSGMGFLKESTMGDVTLKDTITKPLTVLSFFAMVVSVYRNAGGK